MAHQRLPDEETWISGSGAQSLSSTGPGNCTPCKNEKTVTTPTSHQSCDFLTSSNERNDDSGAAAAAQDSQLVAEQDGRSKTKIALIMLALCMGVFLVALDTTIVTTALPTIARKFDSAAGYTWVGSSYLLASAASQPIWGKISDIWGRKPILLLASFIFFLGSLLSGLASSIGMLIAARAVQGLGGGGILVLAQICVSDLFSIRSRGAYFSVLGATWALASSLGPILGGIFTEEVSWRWCFYINLPLGGLAFIIILMFLDLKTPKTPLIAGLKAIDWLGAITIVGGTLMLLFGLLLGGVTRPWNSAIVINLIIFGIVTLILFAFIEVKLPISPIMPMRIFGHQSNIAALGVCFFHGMIFISASYFLPLYFQVVHSASPTRSGYLLLPSAVSISTFAVLAGLIIKKTGKYVPILIVSACLMTTGTGLFIDFRNDTNTPLVKIVVYQLIWGIGVGPNFQAPLIALQSLVSQSDIATATATYGFVRSIATAISVVLGSVAFNNEMENRSDVLVDVLGPRAASQLSGENAGASVDIVAELPPVEKAIVKEAFAQSLRTMWIMYVALAAMAILIGLLVRGQVLSEVHVETKTGLDALADGQKRNSRGGGDVVNTSAGAGTNNAIDDGNHDSGATATNDSNNSSTRDQPRNWLGRFKGKSHPPKQQQKGKGSRNEIELADCEKGGAQLRT